MLARKNPAAAPVRVGYDPFALLRQMTANLERIFEEPFAFNFPTFGKSAGTPAWFPEIDVFENDNHLVTEVDLPGLKKEDVKVEVTNGQLVISGERKTEAEEKKENFYRSERNYGTFYRAVPLPEGVKAEDVKATFINGVLDVRVPLPAKALPTAHKVEIGEARPAVKAA